MNLTKKIIQWFLIFFMVLGLTPHTISAQENRNKDVEVKITDINVPNNTVTEGTIANLKFQFDITKPMGSSFQKGETISITTNLSELFNTENHADIHIKNGDKILATLSFKEKELIFTIEQEEVDELKGIISVRLTAKKVGATKNNDVTKTLTIGGEPKDITFKYFNKPVNPGNMAPVDLARSWKNAGSNELSETGAISYIEINPMGSMDLYGYQSGTTIQSYENLVVKDVIQDHGYIDKDSMTIYASVPTVGIQSKDYIHNGYLIQAGRFYAVREGTRRFLINKKSEKDEGREILTYLEQLPNETYDDFYKRILEGPSWGVYYSKETDTETFLCNFGGVGHSDPDKNNKIKYSDYVKHIGDRLVYSFLQDDGPTAGNIASYYIEYRSYYPDVEERKTVYNEAQCLNVEKTNDGYRETMLNRNTASFPIDNGKGFATVRKNELDLLLVDEKDKAPIPNATFKIQREENGQWVDELIDLKTNEKGHVRIKNINEGTYRIVQTSAPDGYIFDNNSYHPSSNSLLQQVNTHGEFTISNDKSFGFGVIATNKRIYSTNYVFKNTIPNQPLPKVVMDLLPVDTTKYSEDDTINAIMPTSTQVKVENGTWVFKGYDANQKVAKDDNADANRQITFTATWEFVYNEYKVSYSFESSNSMKLPTNIHQLLPTQTLVVHGHSISAPTKTYNDVVVDNGTWVFKGWKPASYDNVSSDVAFVGTWEFKRAMGVINHAPSISANDLTLTVGDTFDALKDVRALDKEDGNLTSKITVLSNTVDTTKPGEYEVTYQVKDSKGAMTTKTIQVLVKEKVVVPSEPTQPNDQSTNTPTTPQTKDDTHITLWIGLLLVSGFILGGVYYYKRKLKG